MRGRVARWGLCALALLAVGPAFPREARGGPEIFALVPDSAGAGEPIRLKGRGLRDARYVVFAAGRTVKKARFRVLSDAELEVTAPDFFLPGVAATVAVASPSGATVGMPPSAEVVDRSAPERSAASFYHVKKGGLVSTARGIAVIEDGGTVAASDPVAMHFVKKGGLLVAYSNGGGVVFHEPGAQFGPRFRDPAQPEGRITYVRVPEITVSPGIAPFLFQAPRQPPGDPRAAPAIRELDPPSAAGGQIITLRGTGFLGTTAVFFADGSPGGLHQAGFRAATDRELKVEVPDDGAAARRPIPRLTRDAFGRLRRLERPQFLVVVNPKGATVTVPADLEGRPLRSVAGLFQYVGRGMFSGRTNGVQYVDSGGVVTEPAGLLFLKNGSRLATPAVGAAFYEPEAVLPEPLANRGARLAIRVPSITPSPLRTMFVDRTP
jgi:hypothetical protein